MPDTHLNNPEHFEALYPPRSRFNEIQKVLSFVKEGNSCQVVSLPGVGRSNVLGFLSFNKAVRTLHLGQDENKYHFVTVNFSEVRDKPLQDVTKFLFLELVESFEERRFTKLYERTYAIFKESLSLQDELVLFNGLKKTIDFIANEEKLRIVFLFDRFEEYVPTITPEFFTDLRSLRNRAKYHFSVVFSLNRPLEEALEPILFADFHEFLAGHTIYLPLVDVAGLEFRLQYIQDITGEKIPETLINTIVTNTGGHGKLSRMALEEILNENKSQEELVQLDQLTEFLLSRKAIIGGLFEIWNSFSPAEQKHLSKKLFDQEYRDDHLQYLEDIGLVKERTITIPLLEAFINKHKDEFSTQKRDSIVYDSISKSIMKGPVNISEKLTPSEFRLLRFMIEHKGENIERDELIQAVWQDKSTAGVTDQALDQLIFRVRKKIEEDPNNPQYLQTIKGRGFTFTS